VLCDFFDHFIGDMGDLGDNREINVFTLKLGDTPCVCLFTLTLTLKTSVMNKILLTQCIYEHRMPPSANNEKDSIRRWMQITTDDLGINDFQSKYRSKATKKMKSGAKGNTVHELAFTVAQSCLVQQ